jgi:DDE family transposase
VLAVDGTTLDVPDTAANAAAFGRPSTHRGERTAFPQVRVLALAECGTHAIIAAVLGPYGSGETTLARELLGRLGSGVLLADRGFVGFDLWRAAAGTGAQLLWRAKTNQVLPVDRQLADGSYLSRIDAARDQHAKRDPVVVRVVEYTLGKDPGRHQQPGPYRLLTTILDPDQAPAVELAALYQQRWEFEMCQPQCTHMRGLAA